MSNSTTVDENAPIDLRFLIPSKAAGVIIGKGGENVTEIRDKYEIKVNIPDSPGPERVLHMSGVLTSVMEALECMLEKLQESMPSSEADIYDPSRNRNRWRRSRSQRDDEDPGAGDENTPSGVDLRMLIHQSQAGTVIGRGGEQIKELREKSSLRNLKVYQMVCPLSTDRVIQMVGDVQRVIHCVRCVIEKINAFQIRGSEQPYDARNFDEAQALSYGGWLGKAALKAVQEYGIHALTGGNPIASGHLPPATLAAIASARANIMNHNVPSSNHGAPMHPHPAMAAAANPMMMMSMMMPATIPGADGQRRGGNPGPMHMDRSGVMPGGGMVKTVQVSVPNSYMGSIMGRGGVRIRSIREESGADIRVHGPDGGDRIIDITGNEPQITYAQQLLKSCVLLYHERK